MHFASEGAGEAGNWKDGRHRSLRRICLRRIGSRSQNEVTWQRNFHDAFGEIGRMCSEAELPTWSLHWARRFLLCHLDLMLSVAKLTKKQDVCSARRKGLLFQPPPVPGMLCWCCPGRAGQEGRTDKALSCGCCLGTVLPWPCLSLSYCFSCLLGFSVEVLGNHKNSF